MAVLAAGRAAAADAQAPPAPPGLYPLHATAGQTDLRQQPSLMPIMKAQSAPVAGPTYYYQKDAAGRSGTVPANYQDPNVAGTPPEQATLPKSAINTVAPKIGEIPVYTEAALQQTIVAEVRAERKSEIFLRFPGDDPKGYEPLTTTPYAARTFQPSTERVEPYFVCYDRLYFEDKNTERYGWELGMLQPLVSAGLFYADLLSFPYNFGTRPCQRFEANAGYCLPGDQVPYLIYPVELSVTGGLLQAGTAVGLAAIFP